MNDTQRKAMYDLGHCKLGREQGRFVSDLVRDMDAELTPRQDWYLRRLQYMYREQIRIELGVSITKPEDFDNPPPAPTKAPPGENSEYVNQNGVFVCYAPASLSAIAAEESERLKAWNAGAPRRV